MELEEDVTMGAASPFSAPCFDFLDKSEMMADICFSSKRISPPPPSLFHSNVRSSVSLLFDAPQAICSAAPPPPPPPVRHSVGGFDSELNSASFIRPLPPLQVPLSPLLSHAIHFQRSSLDPPPLSQSISSGFLPIGAPQALWADSPPPARSSYRLRSKKEKRKESAPPLPLHYATLSPERSSHPMDEISRRKIVSARPMFGCGLPSLSFKASAFQADAVAR